MDYTDDSHLEALELGQQARVLMASEKTGEAKKLLDRALELDPMCADTYDHLGAWYMTIGDFKHAKEQFKKALRIDKERGETYFNLGNACLMLEQMPECLDSYNRALTAGYDQAEMQYFMALAYEQAENYDLALRHLARAILKDPSVPDYKVQKAHLLLRLGRLEDAAETAEELIRSCPELFDGYHLRTVLLQRQERYQEALESAEGAVELFPEDISLTLDCVRCHALCGNYEQACAMLEQARQMKYFEEERLTFGKLEAELHAQRGDLDGAIAALQGILGPDDPLDGPAAQLLMELLLAGERYQELLDTAEPLAALENGDAHYRAALYFKALALERLGRKPEAQSSYREAIRVYRAAALAQPNLLDAYLYRAMSHKALEEFDKALEMTDFLLALDEHQAEPHTIRSDIYRAMGRDADADAEMEQAYAIKPELRELFTAE